MGSHFDHYEKAAIARGKKIGDAAMYARTPEGQKTLLRTVGYGLSMVPGVGLPASAALLGATEGGVHYIDTGKAVESVGEGLKGATTALLFGKSVEALGSMSATGFRKFMESLEKSDQHVTAAQMNLLREMLKYKKSHGTGVPSFASERKNAEELDKIVRGYERRTGTQVIDAGVEPNVPQKMQTAVKDQKVTVNSSKLPSPDSVPVSEGFPATRSQPPAPTHMGRVAQKQNAAMEQLVEEISKWREGLPSFYKVSREEFDAVSTPEARALVEWRADVRKRYGKDRGDVIFQTLMDSKFPMYFYKKDIQGTLGEIEKYGKTRAMINSVVEPNEIIVGGSGGIARQGTLYRDKATTHDVDFAAYINNASRRTDYGSPEATQQMMTALSSRTNIENAEVIRKLRILYPELRDAPFRYAAYDWQWGGKARTQYKNGTFTLPMTGPTVSPDGRVNRLVTTKIGDYDVDIMLSDGSIEPNPLAPTFGTTEAAFDWKRLYMQVRPPHSPQFIKCSTDIAGYKPYSSSNRLIDTSSSRGQFSPYDFPDSLVDRNGIPIVADVETYPGSGETVPVFMNSKGEFLLAEKPDLLWTYDFKHPQNWSRYADVPASKADKPLVAIRGRDPRIGSGGEAAPNIGIYAAANPEKLVDDILKGGRWSTMDDGTFKDIVFYPKEAIDPRADVRNITHDTDAYHDYPSWHKHRDATLPPEVSDKMAREYGEQHPVPEGMYTELGNAYRNRIYEQNPARGFNKDASLGMTSYGGYGEAMPRRYVQDGLRISGEEIIRNPKGARKKLLDAIEQFKFAMPMGVGVGIGGAALETQEAAKAGDTDYTAHEESTGPTDEQLEEAVEFLETVMEIGAPQNEWEQSIVQRTHDILKASIGMPRKEREPENPAPAQGGTNEDAGGGDTDEDDNGPSPEDPRANNTSPQPDTNPVNDRVMHETEDINKPDDSAVTGEKQGVQASVDRSGLKALLLHADNDNEDEEI